MSAATISAKTKSYATTSDHGEAVNYTIPTIPARKAVRLQRQLMPIVASAFDAVSSIGEGGLGNAVLALAKALAESGDAELMVTLLTGTFRGCGGKSKDAGKQFDQIYSGNLGELYVALYEVISHNFERGIKRLYEEKLRPFMDAPKDEAV